MSQRFECNKRVRQQVSTRVLFLTEGRNVPAARFRAAQYVAPLRRTGLRVMCHPSVPDVNRALGSIPAGRLRWVWRLSVLMKLANRSMDPFLCRLADIVVIQRPLLPWGGVSAMERAIRRCARRVVYDYDDAIYLDPDGSSAGRLAQFRQTCDAVVAGNRLLADVAADLDVPVYVIPTVVDTGKYSAVSYERTQPDLLGWTGVSENFVHVDSLWPSLCRVAAVRPSLRLRVVADRDYRPPSGSGPDVENVRWSRQTERRALEEVSVGLMPLVDTPFARAKCAFKAIQYMAMAKPVVTSPVGIAADVVGAGGIVAGDEAEWVEGLEFLLSERGVAAEKGMKGRARVEREFSLERGARLWADVLRRVGAKTASQDAEAT